MSDEREERCEDCGGRYILGSHYCFGSRQDDAAPVGVLRKEPEQ